SLPLLIYARLSGFTRYEIIDGVRIGAWEFYRSPLLRFCFPLTQLVDTVLLSIPKVWIPLLFGKNLLIERFALDVLVDVMVATRQDAFHMSRLGRLFIRLVPKGTRVVLLQAPAEAIRRRREDLRSDPQLEQRARASEDLAIHQGYVQVHADQPISEV